MKSKNLKGIHYLISQAHQEPQADEDLKGSVVGASGADHKLFKKNRNKSFFKGQISMAGGSQNPSNFTTSTNTNDESGR